jgi:arylsulfatase A-like enzyme
MNYSWLSISLLSFWLPLTQASTLATETTEQQQPNFVVILADDLGYSDVGSYGGEIKTAAIDALAHSGTRFSNFHVAATCSPTRSMLLTGVDSHIAGLGNMKIIMAENQFGKPGYEGQLNAAVETFVSKLQRNGYGTYMAGKWHLGMHRSNLPINRGFDKNVALMETGADNWESKPYLPHNPKVHYFDGEDEIQLPKDFYSSDFYTDKLISYLDSHDNQKPFFAYLAFQASHYPHQAPKELTEKYLKDYEGGWELVKSKRYQRLVQLGLMPPGLESLKLPTVEDWKSLSEPQKRYRSKQMAVYAGMIERMDYNIGRLIDHLKEKQILENTVIFFLSDNGADNNEIDKIYPDYIKSNFDTRYETLGEKGSYSNYGASWANVSMTPLSWYKGSASEGGMRAPLIIRYPKAFAPGKVSHSFSFVTDIAATILDLAGVNGKVSDKAAISGRSLRAALIHPSQPIYSVDDVVGYELAGSAAVFKGDYKLVRNSPPFGDKSWKMYNLKNDPVERFDLATNQPKVFIEMLAAYERYAKRVNLIEVPDDYHPVKQLSRNLQRMKDEVH